MPETLAHYHLIPSMPYRSCADYRADVGEFAITKARGMSPEAIIGMLDGANLRGRGGAGFPTGKKWRTLYRHPCRKRSVVCNAAEGEPGTFKDRWLLRHNPYSVIEGMLIAAHTLRTRDLYIVINASYAVERERINDAVREMSDAGLLGECVIRTVAGPEEYLLGEEKALLEVIEGNDPLPREAHYPPYEKGLFATVTSPNPALVNNVETFAHAAQIIQNGADVFRSLGTSDTPGTALFTVCGDVRRPGVYERETTITLRELFYDVAGGPREGRRFKAALPGVSARVIPAEKFETVADYGSLKAIGSGLGSAGFMLFDDTRSMVRVAQTVARFLYVESCDQCTACKYGLGIASQAIDTLFDAHKAVPVAISHALNGARIAPSSNRCYLPVQGSLLIPSLIEHFGEEFRAQAEQPSRDSDPVPLFKIVDFDVKTGEFIYDTRQQLKNPDWSYSDVVAHELGT